MSSPLPCPTDGCKTAINEEYDAYYCATHSVWLEPRCGDDGCDICVQRPAKPPKD